MPHRKFRRIVPAITVMALAFYPARANAEVPPRSPGGQTLEVPEAHLDLGQVYYLTPGHDTQLILTSDAPLRRVVATTSRAVGYVVAPFEIEGAEVPLLAGAFRVPVVSLRTGGGGLDRWMSRPRFFDTAHHPEMTFELTGVRDVTPAGVEKDLARYRLTAVGTLVARGVTKEIAFPVEVTFLLSNLRTMARCFGDLVIITGGFGVKPAEFGYQERTADDVRPRPHDQFAETIRVDLYLFFTTVSPDKSQVVGVHHQQWIKERRFLTLIRDLDDPQAGYTFGRSYLKEIWDNASALERLATIVLTEPDVRQRDFAFAMKAARRAHEVSGGKDPGIAATVARVGYAMGDLVTAVEWQKKAVDQLGPDSPGGDDLRATLKRYQQAIKDYEGD